MNKNRSAVLAWVLCAVTGMGVAVNFWIWRSLLKGPITLFEAVQQFGLGLAVSLTFAVLAAMIIARQPGNRVGWLMMIIALATVNPISYIVHAAIPTVPGRVTLGLIVLLWLEGWAWIPLIFPLFLIPLHFPNGRPLTPRWNWVNLLAVGMFLFFMVFFLIQDTITPMDGAWSLPNPYAIEALKGFGDPFIVLWGAGLVTMLLAGLVSLFLRYRRAAQMERQQIKWLLYAGAIFGLFYITSFINQAAKSNFTSTGWWDILSMITILCFPAAIAIAILRHRLFDIDILIRKTLQYSILSGLLGLVYFGGVALLQALLTGDRGQPSPVVIVLSTLAIAALFNPLRRRVQDFIDRRFYRQKYDAEKALAEFAAAARSETDLGQLSVHLTSTVQDALQPEGVSLWLKTRQHIETH